MKSLAELKVEPHDARYLSLEGVYFDTSAEQADQLAICFYDAISSLLQDGCVIDWQFGRRRIKDISTSLRDDKRKNGSYSFFMGAYLKTSVIKNLSAMRKYARQTAYPPFGYPSHANLCAPWERSMERIMAASSDFEQAKESVLALFDMERIPFDSLPEGYDFYARFSCFPLEETDTGMVAGEISFSASAYTLGVEINFWAERLKRIAVALFEQISNINIRIQLGACNEPYSMYYGYYNDTLFSRTDHLNHRSQILYLTEIGWFHLICPRTASLGINQSSDSDVNVKKMVNGDLLAECRSPIANTNINSLKEMKRILYPLILPRNEFHAHRDLIIRGVWEMVPVFEDEVTVNDIGVNFEHHGIVDLNYLQAY